MNLYEITHEWHVLEQQLIETAGELTEEMEQQYNALLIGGAEKIEAACHVIRRLEGQAKLGDDEAKRITALAASRWKAAERLKGLVLNAVDAMGGKVKTPLFSVWGQNAAEQIHIEVAPDADVAKIAEKHPSLVRTTYDIARDALKALVKEGEQLPNCFTVLRQPGKRFLRVK